MQVDSSKDGHPNIPKTIQNSKFIYTNSNAKLLGKRELMARPLEIFTEQDLQETQWGAELKGAGQDLGRLQIRKLKNHLKIKRSKQRLLAAQGKFENLRKINAANNQWHMDNPAAPPWAHEGTLETYALYQALRGFPLLAEIRGGSPEDQLAKDRLSYSQLDEGSQRYLKDYFSDHQHHDGKDRSEIFQAYWDTQDRLNEIVARIPHTSRPIPVWRGEIYSTERSPWNRDNVFRRAQEIMDLRPGDSFSWETCAATSLDLNVAGSAIFSNPTNPEDFRRVENGEVYQCALFELETDRGVYIDNGLVGESRPNEREVLLPAGMTWEVVGHAQIAESKVRRNDGGRKAFHVIKLKLAE